MVEFLNTEKAYSKIVEIVSKANNRLVLISPYIRISKPLTERLKYMDGKGVKTVVVCREKDLNAEVRGELKQLKNLELRFDEDLHAKCFYNEESMVITSLNLYEHSQQNNREMGVLLSLEDDSNVFNEALNEAEFIVNRAKKDSTIKSLFNRIVKEAKSAIDLPEEDSPRGTKTPSRTKQKGYCIRCGKSISYNENRPYCLNCYKTSFISSSKYAKEFHCHACEKKITTSQGKPLCTACYTKLHS